MKSLNLTNIRKLFQPLMHTPLHPQWLSYRDRGLKSWLGSIGEGATVLDIGCFERWPQALIPASCRYIGLDYPAASADSYVSSVDLWADAHCLPIANSAVDVVLLLDVFEHLRDGPQVLQELHRILNNGGRVLLQVPFMYPIHDSPLDFRRLTREGLVAVAERAGFRLRRCDFRGTPLETACLLLNIALAKLCSRGLAKSKWLALPSVLLAPVVVALNGLGWLASRFENRDAMMPFSYQLELEKYQPSASP
ncbi:MAG: class I SAM-dependent methyltransferase [Gammaproteobacteria bacterium]|nr:class I SAM-dependent methyltransferase [Gammaproteobacteria bacterium]